MKREDVEKRESDLCDLLNELSSPELDVNQDAVYQSIVGRLHMVYDIDNAGHSVYRHSYSQIFIVLSKIHKGSSLNSLDTLIQNLQFVYYKVQSNANPEEARFRKAVYKLYDHVNLDIARINFLDNENAEYYSKVIQGYTALNNSVKKENNDFQTKLSDLKESQEKSKIDLVAILGIFAAIIIGFVAPMAFSSQLLANLKDTPAGKIMIASSVCGFVAISVFYMVYLILENIVFKNREQQPLPEHLKNFRQWTLREWILPVMIAVFVLIFFIGWCKLPEKEGLPDSGAGYHDNSVVVNQNFK